MNARIELGLTDGTKLEKHVHSQKRFERVKKLRREGRKSTRSILASPTTLHLELRLRTWTQGSVGSISFHSVYVQSVQKHLRTSKSTLAKTPIIDPSDPSYFENKLDSDFNIGLDVYILLV